ncbi:hypothetical protein [Flavobacterium sp.]|nr:hypothetical protein [Flavobacterium sp.]
MKPPKVQIITPKKSDAKKAAALSSKSKNTPRTIKKKLNEFGDSDAL